MTAEGVRAWKAEHPGAAVVAYVNTDAAVKAEVDYCATSSNAQKVIESIPADQEILFLPDQFLGLYLQSVTGRRMHLWLGECHVHAAIGPADVDALFARHPDADLLLHPECGCVSQCLWRLAEGDLPADRTFVLSTGGMVAHARDCPRPVDLVGTETGMLHRLRQVNPAKTFVPLREDAVCSYMKTITVPKLYRALRDDVYPVTVPDTGRPPRPPGDRPDAQQCLTAHPPSRACRVGFPPGPETRSPRRARAGRTPRRCRTPRTRSCRRGRRPGVAASARRSWPSSTASPPRRRLPRRRPAGP